MKRPIIFLQLCYSPGIHTSFHCAIQLELHVVMTRLTPIDNELGDGPESYNVRYKIPELMSTQLREIRAAEKASMLHRILQTAGFSKEILR